MKKILKRVKPDQSFIIKTFFMLTAVFFMTAGGHATKVYAARFTCAAYFDELTQGSARENKDEDSGSYRLIVKDGDEEIGRIEEDQIKSGFDAALIDELPGRSHDDISAFPDLSAERRYDIITNLNYDDKLIDNAIRNFDLVSSLPDEPEAIVRIVKNDSGVYELEDNLDSLKDKQKLIDHIKSAVERGDTQLDISDFDYDLHLSYTDEQEKTLALFENVDALQKAEVIIEDQGNKVELDASDIASFLICNDDGSLAYSKTGKPILSEGDIVDVCDEITEEFSSKDSVIYWKKHNGGTVSLNSGKYGVEVDPDATYELVINALVSGKGYEGKPVYTEESADNELGDTYVEVDMTRQHMYYFEDGELLLDSDVVTGNKAHHNDTPETIEPIYFMQKNRVLVGANYRTPVKYWMAFHNHVGLHDANWRSKFGGDIYKTDGSHGCVNLPTETAARLYELVEVGTPVITYY